MGVVWDGTVALALFAAALAAGWPWVSLAGVGWTRGERLCLSAGLGYGILSLLTLGLGSLGLLVPEAVVFAAGLAIALAWGLERARIRGRMRPSPPPVEPFPRSVLWIPSGILLFHILLGALTPEVRSDPVTYHASLAIQYAVTGDTAGRPWHLFSYFPSNQEMLYTLGYLFTRDTAGKLICFSHAVLLAAGVGLLARRLFGARYVPLSVLVLLLLHWTTYLATTMYIDVSLALYELLALLCLVPALREDRRGAWILAGAFAGLALGTKYTAIPLFIVPLGGALVLFRLGHRSFSLANLAVFAVVAVLLFTPWMARNAVATGNPLFPMFTEVLGPGGALVEDSTRWLEAATRPSAGDLRGPGAIGDWVLKRLRLVATNGGSFPFVFMACGLLYLGLAERGRRFSEWGLLLTVYFLLVLAAFLFVSNNASGRFLYPLYAVMAAVLGYWLLHIQARLREKNLLGVAAVFVPAVLLLMAGEYASRRITSLHDLQESAWPVVTEEARTAYYARHGFPPPDFLETLVPEGGVLWGGGYPARVESISWHHGWRDVVNPGDAPWTPELAAQRAREMGIVLVRLPNACPVPREVLEALVEQRGELALKTENGGYYRLKDE